MISPAPDEADNILDALLSLSPPPTALIGFEDYTVLQLFFAARRRGMRIPGDLSLLGCANNWVCGYLTPAFTSIEQHPEEIGRLALDVIQRRRGENTAPGERTPETMLVPPHLEIRESCAPPG